VVANIALELTKAGALTLYSVAINTFPKAGSAEVRATADVLTNVNVHPCNSYSSKLLAKVDNQGNVTGSPGFMKKLMLLKSTVLKTSPKYSFFLILIESAPNVGTEPDPLTTELLVIL
jgi:hypothetical protein